MMARPLAPAGTATRPPSAPRVFAGLTAALACVAATDSSAVLVNKLLTDGAAMAAACALARLVVWMARGLWRAARAWRIRSHVLRPAKPLARRAA
jgi:hypothetical protein